MEKSKFEREEIQSRMDARKEREKDKSEILKTVKKQIEMEKTADNISNNIPLSRPQVKDMIDASLQRIKKGAANIETSGFIEDGGKDFCDIKEILRQDALERHGNDPNKRLDECGFPRDRADREFLLNHKFEDLDQIVTSVKFSWIYLYGDSGRGKTSFAIRIVWELIKNNPTEKATFLSIGKWTDSLRVGKQEYIPLSKLRKIVVIDDFDKFDAQKPFQIRQLLLLVEELKNRHLVIFTSNYSREEILKLNPKSTDLEVMLDRIKGKSIDFPRFTGESYR